MEFTNTQLITYTSWGLAALAVWIIVRCAISLLQGKKVPEIWGYLELPGGSSRVIHHWECILGRSRSSDIVLNSKSVELSHAAIQRDGGGKWIVRDLGSAAGTLLNGKKLTEDALLTDGDTITVGDMSLRFIDLSDAQRRTLQRKRPKVGYRVHPGATLLLLSVFQLLLLLQLITNVAEAYTVAVCAAFGVLLALEWCSYFLMRSLSVRGFEPEILAFFLTSVGFSVAASAAPQDMVKECILLWAAILCFFLMGWWLRDLRRVRAMRWVMGIAALALLGVNLLYSEVIFGARNWLTVAGISFQPSELVKVAYIYAGAATLDRLYRKRNLWTFVAFSAVCVGALALMADFGTALVFFVCFLVISFLRSGSFATVILALSGAGLGGLLVLAAKPHVAQRFMNWRHVWEDSYGAGYQQTRAMSAAASGGLFGRGAGGGWLKDVVAADTDLVFGVVSEELGLIVGICCILAILLLALFSVRNVATGRSAYYVIASCAAVTVFMTQLALNVFGSVDILPFTGVTFPFVSRGGSSLISCWCMLAFIKAGDTRQNASFALRDTFDRKKKKKAAPEKKPAAQPTSEKKPAAKTPAKTPAKKAAPAAKKAPAGKKKEAGK